MSVEPVDLVRGAPCPCCHVVSHPQNRTTAEGFVQCGACEWVTTVRGWRRAAEPVTKPRSTVIGQRDRARFSIETIVDGFEDRKLVLVSIGEKSIGLPSTVARALAVALVNHADDADGLT